LQIPDVHCAARAHALPLPRSGRHVRLVVSQNAVAVHSASLSQIPLHVPPTHAPLRHERPAVQA
jgi:hypothetical protein